MSYVWRTEAKHELYDSELGKVGSCWRYDYNSGNETDHPVWLARLSTQQTLEGVSSTVPTEFGCEEEARAHVLDLRQRLLAERNRKPSG
jgi:hypothetical protein